MTLRWIVPAIAVLAGAVLPAQTVDYDRLEAEGERLYAEGSYAAAHELYLKADPLPLPPPKARWVDFRIADTLWRSQAGSATADPTKYEKALAGLTALVRDAKTEEDRDRVWAEVAESVGDFHWTRRDMRNWGAAWPHYQQALDWWAGSRDLERARDRYLGIVWKSSSPPGREEWYSYGAYGNNLPLPVLENALRIAPGDADRARAQYLIAMTIRNQGGDAYGAARAREAFEAAIAAGRKTDWYDDALYHYAEWLLGRGRIIPLEDGNIREEPDYPRALELFERFVSEHRKGETRYYDQARQRIVEIRTPVLNVAVPEVFLPGTEVEYSLAWRNLKKIDLALYPIDLTRDVDLSSDPENPRDAAHAVNLAGKENVLSWSKDTEDKGDHAPRSLSLRIDEKVPAGAYVLEARAERLSARDIVLVTDATLVLKTTRSKALVYFADSRDGSPAASAQVSIWHRWQDGSRWRVRHDTGVTDASGLALFELSDPSQQGHVFAAASLKGRQAFATGNAYRHHGDRNLSWRIYAYTDRPAYRPGEKAEWKVIARTHDGVEYGTPANRSLRWQVTDPRGAKAGEGTAALNPFGSAWGSLELTDKMPLGQYTITFWDGGTHVGQAQLLRLEEYKLPEFRVSVTTPEEGGKRKTFRLGEVLHATVSAEYYFGGAVAGASVEVIVHQKPYWFWWSPEREYPWYYENAQNQRRGGWGRGQIVKRETVKLDSTGKAQIAIETPRGGGQDLEYDIEARVTDSSRREVAGQSSVRVTRQRYAVHARAEHNIYRPRDKVRVLFKALDANGGPVEVEGKVRVRRDTWVEVWVSPEGKEVRGRDLEELRRKLPAFPPDGRWRLRFRGYEHEDVLAEIVKTGKEGDAELIFTPEREGYYRVAWRSDDPGGPPITADTTVWVCTSESTDLGYRHSAVEIIADRDTFRAGEKAPVMLSVPAGGRHVLFSVESEDLLSWQVVHVTGTVKLLEVEIGEKHVPNAFLSAVLPSDLEVHMDTKEVVVPPVKNFLTVEVATDKPEYLPREEGTVTITARDSEGKPARAEVSLSLVDESVYYIQSELAGDPRSFFFGEKRPHRVETSTTLQQKGYARDERRKDQAREQGWSFDDRGEMKNEEFQEAEKLGVAADGGGRRFRGAQLAKRTLALADASAAPAAAMELDSLSAAPAEGAGASGGEPAVQVRTDFRSTVVWRPDVVTGEDGKATVAVKFPDSLTSWRATTRAATARAQFGHASATARTRQPLIVRLQAPRFFVAGDSVVISAVINNNTDKPLSVEALLEADGLEVEGALKDGRVASAQPDPISVDARGEARVDWVVQARKAGNARLKTVARARTAAAPAPADAMEKTYVVHEHGIEKLLSSSGKMRGDTALVRLDLPAERKPGSTGMVVQIAPSIAVTMLDALPYLADYPYGCTEQTMSRFLPAVITAKTLKDLGLDAAAVEGKLFGGIEPATAGKTHPKGKTDLRRLDEMAQLGLARLFDFQHADGGWGWWKAGESDHFMTAYVVWGLTLARQAGLDVKPDPLARGAAFLDKEIVEAEESPDLQAWMLHALATHAAATGAAPSDFQKKALQNLWSRRDALNAYSRALVALAAHHMGDADKAKTLVRNLENGVKRDADPGTSVILGGPKDSRPEALGTAHWGEDRLWWRWSEGGVESTAFVLRAILAIAPENELVEPVMHWLVKNRRGAQWSNTRDTAIVVLALNDYLRRSGELSPEVEYDVLVNGKPLVSKKVSAAEALSAPSRFTVDPRLIADGANEVQIVRKGGRSPLYFGVEAVFFSLEEPIVPAGNEIFVRRDYRKLVPQPTLLKGWVPERLPLADRGKVRSGERVEVILTIEAKNNYEYLVFEDLKPAGLEAAEVRSGDTLHARELKSGAIERSGPGGAAIASQDDPANYTGRSVWVYQELRDRKVACFIDKLPEGVWEIRYEMRAEVPGDFHGLPLMAHAMYVPEIRANGAETRIRVEDADPTGQRTRRAVVGGE